MTSSKHIVPNKTTHENFLKILDAKSLKKLLQTTWTKKRKS